MNTAVVTWLGGKVLDAAWSEAMKRIFKKRLDTARKILIEELERGTANLVDVEDTDEAAAMVFEFADATQRGTARRNLRMLAQVLAGSLATPPIYAGEFLRWARVIADLTQTEIIVLATFHKLEEIVSRDPSKTSMMDTFNATLLELVDRSVCKDKDDLRATLQALGRHGLVLQHSLLGGLGYSTTANLAQLLQLVRLEDILKEPER